MAVPGESHEDIGERKQQDCGHASMLPHSSPSRQTSLTGRNSFRYNGLVDTRWTSLRDSTEKALSEMANHFSALKRARQTETRTQRNRSNNSRLRSALRDLREALAKGDKAAAEQVFRKTVSALDKAIQKGVLHENTAGRYKSRLSARVNALK
jgi:small subunit ribosomal protein S20